MSERDPILLELETLGGAQPAYPFPPLPALYIDRMEAEVVSEVMERNQSYESHVVERRVNRLIEGAPTPIGAPLYELRAGPDPEGSCQWPH